MTLSRSKTTQYHLHQQKPWGEEAPEQPAHYNTCRHHDKYTLLQCRERNLKTVKTDVLITSII